MCLGFPCPGCLCSRQETCVCLDLIQPSIQIITKKSFACLDQKSTGSIDPARRGTKAKKEKKEAKPGRKSTRSAGQQQSPEGQSLSTSASFIPLSIVQKDIKPGNQANIARVPPISIHM